MKQASTIASCPPTLRRVSVVFPALRRRLGDANLTRCWRATAAWLARHCRGGDAPLLRHRRFVVASLFEGVASPSLLQRIS